MGYEFHSRIAKAIEAFVQQKNALGYPYTSSSRILVNFDRLIAEKYPTASTITREIVMDWASLKDKEHINGLIRRITPIRQLAKYMNGIGMTAYVLPTGLPGKGVRYVPHIYTREELTSFFSALDQCEPSPFSRGRHLVIPTFFRVLYCCGLRSSEARLLKSGDIDLETGNVFIRQSKGHKDRYVVLADDVRKCCMSYNHDISIIYPNREAFFPNQTGGFYDDSTPDFWFHLYWDKLEVAKCCPGSSPRVHDFRHTFAVKRLNQWVIEGKDVQAYLPYLSMYLGHVNLADTDYYLHLVPEFYPIFRDMAMIAAANLIPEAAYE